MSLVQKTINAINAGLKISHDYPNLAYEVTNSGMYMYYDLVSGKHHNPYGPARYFLDVDGKAINQMFIFYDEDLTKHVWNLVNDGALSGEYDSIGRLIITETDHFTLGV